MDLSSGCLREADTSGAGSVLQSQLEVSNLGFLGSPQGVSECEWEKMTSILSLTLKSSLALPSPVNVGNKSVELAVLFFFLN